MKNAVSTVAPQRLNWANIAFLTATPLVAAVGGGLYVWRHGVTWLEVALFLVLYLFTGMGITGGYHRYYAHRTYNASKPLQLFYLVFGAAAAENSVLNWASDHRYHHRYVDRPEDPYNILRGGLYAHIGWIFYKDERKVHDRFQNIPDLLKDPLVVWQDRWYLFLVVAAGFVLPALVGLLEGRPGGALLWGGFIRVVVVHHMTFFINSLAHLYGTKPYDVRNSARDSWWLGVFTFGEGYHNFHHKFQADYRNGIRWYQFDLTKWWLHLMRLAGQAGRLKRTPEPLILKARLEVEMLRVAERLEAARVPERLWTKVQPRLEAGRRRLESAMAQYQHARLEYRRRKAEWSADVRREWRRQVEAHRDELAAARERWRDLIAAMNRIPQPAARGLLTVTALLDLFKGRIG